MNKIKVYFCAMGKFKIVALYLLFILPSCNSGDKNSTSQRDSVEQQASTPKPYPAYVQRLITEVKENPDSSAMRLRLASLLDSIGAYQQALQHLDTLLKKDSGNFGLWYANGEIAEDAKDTTRAMMSYARAIGIYASPDAMLSLA